MKRIIQLFSAALLALTGSIAAWGQGTFNPAEPPEPGLEGTTEFVKYKLTVVGTPTGSGTVYGSGAYAEGRVVSLSVSTASGYSFVCWTTTDGEVLSTSSSLKYTMPAHADTVMAHFDFTPAQPAEPVDPATILYYPLTLSVSLSGAGSVSGGGRYQAGKKVGLSASTNNGYRFTGWTNQDDEIVSTAASFSYTTRTEKDTLTANYVFDPSIPTEPDALYKISVTSSDGGYTSGTSNGRYLEGSSQSFHAYCNTGYTFIGWYKNGEFYTSLTNFSYTMTDEDVTFHAQFEFNPSVPGEPLSPRLGLYTFYLMTVNGLPGQQVDYPIWFTSQEPICDLTIQLTFPKDMMPNLDEVQLSDKAVGYTDVSIGVVEDTVLVVTMLGGQIAPGNSPLLTFPVLLADTLPTGMSHQVKINQISLTQTNGETITARTRNGRLGIYKRGDTNGDNVVDVSDVLNLVSNVMEVSTPTFIPEVSDVNEDGTIDVQDVLGVVEIAISE